MTDPVRLLDDEASSYEANLLRAWEDEKPDPAARARVLAALGVGTALPIGATAATNGAAKAAASIAPKAGGVALSLTTKALLVTTLLAGTAIGVNHFRAHEAPTPAKAAPRAVTTAEAPAALAPPAASAAPPSLAVEALPVATIDPSRTARHHADPAPSSAPPPALAQQIAELDRARGALAAGDAPGAERLALACERRFPDGALRQEAEVVRIDAIARQGDADRARRAAESFLAKYPGSPHAAHVRTFASP